MLVSNVSVVTQVLRKWIRTTKLILLLDDCQKLYTDYSISTRNCVDLSLLARSVDNPRWKGKYSNPIGLARLVETYEELALPKGRITRSNWEAKLSDQQQDCMCNHSVTMHSPIHMLTRFSCVADAANDGHSGFTIYTRLIAMAQSMANIPQPEYFSFDFVRGRLCQPSGMHWYPYNPDYDPGPPPPPKEPKTDKALNGKTAKTAVAQIHGVPAPTSSPAINRKHNRPPHLQHAGINLGMSMAPDHPPTTASQNRQFPSYVPPRYAFTRASQRQPMQRPTSILPTQPLAASLLQQGLPASRRRQGQGDAAPAPTGS